ncbi:MAG: hypothetical protein J07HQX50_01650 [Haloquadratum sp. J07HQX50]|nr:MAG: hypothetical protein J07HQX50_01650 [Haloquadratum sp. J07HQX50]
MQSQFQRTIENNVEHVISLAMIPVLDSYDESDVSDSTVQAAASLVIERTEGIIQGMYLMWCETNDVEQSANVYREITEMAAEHYAVIKKTLKEKMPEQTTEE